MIRRLHIWFAVTLIGVVSLAITQPTPVSQLYISLPWGITKLDDEYVVLGRLYETDDPEVDVHRADSLWVASITPWWTRGPWYGRVEFYDKIEFDLTVYNTDHNNNPRPKRDQYPLIKQALQRYFEEHGLMPADGYETRTRYIFLKHEAKISILRITLFLVLSVALTGLIDWLWRGIRKRSWRQTHGLCDHCGYDCEGLTTPICPECGHNHAQPASA